MTWDEIKAAINEKVTAAKSSVETEGLSREDAEKATNKALADELKNLPQEVRQFIHDGGHKQATAESAVKLQKLEDAKTALEAEKAKLEGDLKDQKTKIEEIEAKTPDVAALRTKLQNEFAETETRLKNEADEAKKVAEELRTARKTDKVESFQSRLLSVAGSRVTQEGQEWVQNRIDRLRLDGRFVPKETDNGFTTAVLRPGSQELEYVASGEDELLKIVTDEVLTGAPKWAVKANVSGGGGSGAGGSGGGSNKWDKIRKDTGERGVQPGQESLNDRRSKLLPQD